MVTIHMVSSLDGFIANDKNTVDWMITTDKYEKGKSLSDADIINFNSSIDCYIIGAHTYEHALKLGWPYGKKPVFVFTHRLLKSDRENVFFIAGDVAALVNQEIRPHFNNIWVGGGANLIQQFLNCKMADRIIVSIMPILLGGGKPFFEALNKEQRLHLKEVTPYNDGMVELTYSINDSS